MSGMRDGMLTVYAIPVSLYCAKLRIVLRHKDLDWTEIPPPGGYGSDEYKRMVPAGNLPALRNGGLLIADSEAISEYLEEVFPNPPMLPVDAGERAQIRARSRFHDTRLEPAVRRLFPYITAAPGPGELAPMAAEISTRLGQFANVIRDVPAGSDLTLGDCGYPITFLWIHALAPLLDIKIAWPDPVRDWSDGLDRHHAVAAERASYGKTLNDWLKREWAGH